MNIDKYQQSMENWKKQIIIDPHLNSLFDREISAEQFLSSKILTLPQEEIVKVYMKLTSLKHSITKNMQKQIQIRHPKIQNSFQQCLRSKSVYESINQQKIRQNLKQVQKFNQKYQFVSDRVTELKNINKILHFAKALQKFKVNVRLLKSMMKDFDQISNSLHQSELINTLKISKIIKEISAITVKFDFSGIKYFEEERVFINSTKGAVFGLIEKQLTAAFIKIPNRDYGKRAELEKDIINKFTVLSNINKLKDFCIPFYKNTLKQMSELLKKSLAIGQSADERDPKKYLTIFEEYFTYSVIGKIVQNSAIFITYDELLGRTNIKTPFNFNFFQKYWENITGFMKDLIYWSIENDTKQWSKQKLAQSLYQSFQTLQNRGTMNKYMTSILWKYPLLYEALTSISNEVHFYLIKYSEVNHYDFSLMKQKFIIVLLPLAQLYYKNVKCFFNDWKTKIERIVAKYILEDTTSQNFPLNRVVQLFDDQRQMKNGQHLYQYLAITQWLTFNIKAKEIYQYFVNEVLSITQVFYEAARQTMQKYDPQRHQKDNFVHLIDKFDSYISKIRARLQLGKLQQNSRGQSHRTNFTNSEKFITVIKTLKKYAQFCVESRSKLV